MTLLKATLALLAGITASACAIGVTSTPGLESFEAGNFAEAKPQLEAELNAGTKAAAYALGMMYLNGTGVEVDEKKAERLLVEASMAGDPRAVDALAAMYGEQAYCPKDERLRKLWRASWAQKNLVTGMVEVYLLPPVAQVEMAQIYLDPCPGRETQDEAALALAKWSQTPRSTYIYIPG